MPKYYIKPGDKAYTTGAFIKYEGKGRWSLLTTEDDTYYDGELVSFTEDEPYIEQKEELDLSVDSDRLMFLQQDMPELLKDN